MKQFQAESQKLLDMMINSIYTHKEIFLRELISNASDAIDKLYYRSLSDTSLGLDRSDFEIRIDVDKDARTITISDNGCGMDEEGLETNLGTIAHSGSLNFKKENEKKEDIDVIGQFGVGFYSAFMVADKVTVDSKAYGSDQGYRWESTGAEGYTIECCDKEDYGTVITLHIKEDSEEEKYSEFLDSYRLESIVRKYSDYIRYPIIMKRTTSKKKEGTEDEYEDVVEEATVNSMVPIWKKTDSEVTEDELKQFYKEKFYDYEDPAKVIRSKAEGTVSYTALLYVPRHAPYDYYSKNFEKGLQLYSGGVLIMEKCADLLPDYFSFVTGLVDSEDISLNISREMLQHDRQLKAIAKSLEKKIKNELLKLMQDDRATYEEFFKAMGAQIKFGIYNDYGMHKDLLQDLLLFYSSKEKKLVSLAEYVSRMPEGQNTIYYACGETVDKIDMLPQTEAVKEKDYEILYLTENIDEFALKALDKYQDKTLTNIGTSDFDLSTDEEKETVKKANEDAKDMFALMKESLGDSVKEVRYTNKLKNHPVCLASVGEITVEMEKVYNAMPGQNGPKIHADLALEISVTHPIAEKLKSLYLSDKDKLKDYTKVLFNQARIIEGLPVENPTEFGDLLCALML
ncbi:MAG: molecular chaperone HtpG [Eubacteriales bacterium]